MASAAPEQPIDKHVGHLRKGSGQCVQQSELNVAAQRAGVPVPRKHVFPETRSRRIHNGDDG